MAFVPCFRHKRNKKVSLLTNLFVCSMVGVTGFSPVRPSPINSPLDCLPFGKFAVQIFSPFKSRLQSIKKDEQPLLFVFFVVGVTGFEPTTSWSRTKRATNCATPRRQNKFRLPQFQSMQIAYRYIVFPLSQKVLRYFLREYV